MTNYYFLNTPDGERIYVEAWLPEPSLTRGVIQLVHGLGETTSYYSEFGYAALQSGFAVYILEARGHGRTAGEINSPDYALKGGDIGENGFPQLRDDQYLLTRKIKSAHTGRPVFLLGHSLGSVVSRYFAYLYGSEIDGLILTGAPAATPRINEFLKIAEHEIQEKGPKTASKATFEAMFAELNRPFEPATTPLDWITSDKEMIVFSLEQPYTYVLFNNQFYQNYLVALKEVDREQNLARLPLTLPILLLSGSADVVTENGGLTLALFNKYRQVGLKDLQYRLYNGRRHSILREINRGEVFSDIFGWLEERLVTGK
jgi:alpha-beta hydrolase superfamily lysophospholipase